MEQKEWAELRDGRKAYRYTFENKKGMRMCVSNFGALLLNVIIRDRDHKAYAKLLAKKGQRKTVKIKK